MQVAFKIGSKYMILQGADVAELVDARDLKPGGHTDLTRLSCKTRTSRPTEISADPRHLQNTPLVHFVRFDNLHDQHFWNAVRVFGHPDYLHRFWDRRALREIDRDDIVLFAKGDADQPFHPFTADDEAYQ